MAGLPTVTRFRARGFKSLVDVEIECRPMMVLFGPNAVGKSNLLEAMILLSEIVQGRALAEAFDTIQRGRPAEAFSLPGGGLAELMARDSAALALDVDLRWPEPLFGEVLALRYGIAVSVEPGTGEFALVDERLAVLCADGTESEKHRPRIEVRGDRVWVRGRRERLRERREPLAHFAVASNLQIGGADYPELEALRRALARWRFFYLDPALAMRQQQAPREVHDVGSRGQDMAPLLYRLKNRDGGRGLRAVTRTVRSVIPSVSEIDVELDRERGTLDLWVVQDGTRFSSRVISEGTLRLLALCTLAASPDPPELVAFEEPENGVHPQRVAVVANILTRLAERGHQVVVTTHSPVFAASMIRLGNSQPERIGLYTVHRSEGSTAVRHYRSPFGPLFDEAAVKEALSLPEEEEILQRMMRGGWLDG